MRNSRTSGLLAALKARFKNPKDALRALGLDENLLSLKRLGLDSALKRPRGARDAAKIGEVDPMELYVQLEELICKHVSTPARTEMLELVGHALGTGDYDRAYDVEAEAEDEGEAGEEESFREKRKRMMQTIARFLAERKGLSEDEIAQQLADFPLNGIQKFEAADDLEALMKERGMASNKGRDRRLAHDAAAERRFFDLFPEAKRIGGARPERPVAMDGAGSIASGYDFFEDAARISQAGGGS